jgi:hypothetical protein
VKGLLGAAAFFIGVPLLFFVMASGLHSFGLTINAAVGITLLLVISAGYALEKRF